MSDTNIPPEALAFLKAVTGKRTRVVDDYLLTHGSITTQELESRYGYKHPPRAIRDVIERGVPLLKATVISSDNRRIAEYRFGDLSELRVGHAGRRALPKAFKDKLLAAHGSRCGVCNTDFDPRYLQVDHRIPYEISGDDSTVALRVEDFMLLCGSCNRAKSWSCENCRNWTDLQDPAVCRTCYWATPKQYEHVATQSIRRADLTWTGDEVEQFDAARVAARASGVELPAFVKEALRKSLRQAP